MHRELQQIFAEKRESFASKLQLRMRRAISWIDHAEQSDDDDDSRFIFYWIALNAAYSTEVQDGTSEMALLDAFLEQIVELDEDKVLHGLVSEEFPNIRLLLENKYIFRPFWDPRENWEEELRRENAKVDRARRESDTHKVLYIVLNRLYTLRNQLVHGGATWRGSVNRRQVEDGARMLASIVPRIVRLMMDYPERHQQWGSCPYPVIRDSTF